tara:strand:- start:1053 stop:1451 length:399 start_codon:yes stop_codon:yes gene_type:complete
MYILKSLIISLFIWTSIEILIYFIKKNKKKEGLTSEDEDTDSKDTDSKTSDTSKDSPEDSCLTLATKNEYNLANLQSQINDISSLNTQLSTLQSSVDNNKAQISTLTNQQIGNTGGLPDSNLTDTDTETDEE